MFKWQSYINLGLRAAGLGAKFILIVFIGKYFSTELLGVYGLFSTTITLSVLVLGLDFYTYNMRELIHTKDSNKPTMLRDQLVFHLLTYVFAVPLLLLIFLTDIIPIKYIFWFYLILVLEHFSQEFFRLFTTLSKPITANIILFVRTGLWIYVVVAVWIFGSSNFQTLESVFFGWAIGSGLSIGIATYFIIQQFKNQHLGKIQWKWIWTGIKISLPFMLSTIASKVIEFSDRYMINWWLGKDDVGVYTFFVNISNLINVLVFTSVIMIFQPRIIATFKNMGDELKTTKKSFFGQTIGATLLGAVFVLALIWPLLQFLNKNEFSSEINTFYILVVANLLLNISLVYHTFLYAIKKDRTILYITIVAALANFVLNFLLILPFGIIGAATSTAIAFGVLMIGKLVFWKKAEAFNL
jgi:O-antigen/teichoic acid export membrane protein